jgi:protein-S-isoprenylcysteine O-methyltransferase Ste14
MNAATRQFSLHVATAILWALFAIFWFGAAELRHRRSGAESRPANKISDSPAVRFVHHGLLVVAFVLLFARQANFGILGQRFLPRTTAIRIAGFVITVAGLALAVWARRHLADNWSSRVRIRVGHELIRTGPYAHLRHPIYSGVLLAVIGTAVEVGRYRALVSVFLILISYGIKARREDAVLAREFGEAWAEHRRRAGFLLPRF